MPLIWKVNGVSQAYQPVDKTTADGRTTDPFADILAKNYQKSNPPKHSPAQVYQKTKKPVSPRAPLRVENIMSEPVRKVMESASAD